ncbi:hypothetical protein FQN60_007996, partial [Etheostoma spectabile]
MSVAVIQVEPSVAPADVEDATLLNTPLFNATEVCKKTPETDGPCRGQIPRYFFNSSSTSCQLFTYGGCGGNQNNFQTEKECMQRCHTVEVCKQKKSSQCRSLHWTALQGFSKLSEPLEALLTILEGCPGKQRGRSHTLGQHILMEFQSWMKESPQ